MKAFRFLLPGLLVALVLLSAFRAANTRETRTVAAFSSVGLGGSMHVVLRQGSPQKVEAEGNAEDLAHLETTVSNGRLRINLKKESGLSWYNTKGPITVYVTMPTINALVVSGSGSIKAADGIRGEKLDLAVSGSGSVQLTSVTADKITSSISGSGSIQAAGTAADQDISISGSGNMQAPKLQSKTCSVRVSGSGVCRVYASSTLDARIAGSGNVFVMGNPKVSSSVAGSGRVRQE